MVGDRTSALIILKKQPRRSLMRLPRGCEWFRGQSHGLLLALLLKAAVGACCKLLLELVDSPSRINVFELARVKRVTLIANIDLQFRSHAACLESVAATAGHSRFLIIWVNAVFHGVFQWFEVSQHWLEYSAVEPRNVRQRTSFVQGL